MKISEVNFDTMEYVRKKCITYAEDGNTLIKPYKTLYSVENFMHNKKYHNLYVEILKENEKTMYQLWEDIQVICIGQGYFSGEMEIDTLAEKLEHYPYLEVSGFYKRLEELEQEGHIISKLFIDVCVLLGNTELAKHYAECRERRIQEKEAEEMAEYEARKKAEEEEERTKIEKAIQDAENAIRLKRTLHNDKFEGKAIVLYLLQKYGVKVPLKTQGWINNALAQIYFRDGEITYMYYTSSRDSTVFHKYLKELEEKILRGQ